MSAKIAVSSSITWLIGWMRPRVSGPSRTGRLTSMRSAARRCSSAASASASLRVAIAPWTLSRSPLMSGPLLLALLRRHGPERLQEVRDGALLAERRHAQRLERGLVGARPRPGRAGPVRVRRDRSSGFGFREGCSVAGPAVKRFGPKRTRRLGRAAGGKASEGWDDGASFAPPAVRLRLLPRAPAARPSRAPHRRRMPPARGSPSRTTPCDRPRSPPCPGRR